MAESEADRPDGPIAPGVEAEERAPGRWPVSPRVAVAATVLIIAVAGLSIGKASSTNEPQPAEAREQAELPARAPRHGVGVEIPFDLPLATAAVLERL